MANIEHLENLKKGKSHWNNWISENWRNETLSYRKERGISNYVPTTRADLSNIDLTDFQNLEGYDFYKVNFKNSNLKGINFTGCKFRKSNLSNCNLQNTIFDHSDLEYSFLLHSNLDNSSLQNCQMEGANLSATSLHKTNFNGSRLFKSWLKWSRMIETNFNFCDLSFSRIYGASIWAVELEGAKQNDIIITKRDDSIISIDNLELAQFIYLILNNSKIKNIIDTLTSKVVLILGRFEPKRKEVLESIKSELRTRGLIPMIFDFDKPNSRDYIEPVITISQLSKFIIADFTEPKIVLEEVPIILNSCVVPIVPIISDKERIPTTLLNNQVKYNSLTDTLVYCEPINYKQTTDDIIKRAEYKLSEIKKQREKTHPNKT